jgi:hypothetical protein
VEKGGAGQVRDVNIIQRMRSASCITEEYVILIFFFAGNNGCTNASHCYVIRTLPV